MEQAAHADATARERGDPAMSKLQLLPDVSALLNRGGAIQQSLVDPDNGLLDGIRFFLEPTMPDGSLPAYNIQKDMFAILPKLPIGVEELRGCKLGQVVLFYTKSKKPEPAIKRQAERLLTRWMGLILKRSDDYRQRDPAQANGEAYVFLFSLVATYLLIAMTVMVLYLFALRE
jgi:transcription factor SPN1